MAEDEFSDADDMRLRRRFYIALFHFQQATEKALKAFIYFYSEESRVLFTHAIVDLIQVALQLASDFDAVRSSATLDQYYIPTRYPNGLPGMVPPSRFYQDEDEALRASQLARSVLDLARRKLKDE